MNKTETPPQTLRNIREALTREYLFAFEKKHNVKIDKFKPGKSPVTFKIKSPRTKVSWLEIITDIDLDVPKEIFHKWLKQKQLAYQYFLTEYKL